MRIGLLGGSFDPVHCAHIALATQALRELSLDEVQLIPAGQPWQRPPLSASPEHRIAMLEIAIQGHPGLVVNPLETQRSGPTFTIETLLNLPPGPTYYWILGADQLQNFCTWHRWQEIIRLTRLAVVARPGSTLVPPPLLQDQMNLTGQTLSVIPFEPMNIAARDIRQRLATGKTTSELLSPAVSNYIARHGLFQQHSKQPIDKPT